MYNNDLIYGKSKLERIVAVEPAEDCLKVFQELKNGDIKTILVPNTYWIITPKRISSKQTELEGKQFFKYIAEFDNLEEADNLRKKLYQKRIDFYRIADTKEASLVYLGITYFKGMQPKEVSVLSFDIETDGLVKHKGSEIYTITNTFRKNGEIVRKAFHLDDYSSQAEMLEAWCDEVQYWNPSIILGHNIYGYDFLYLDHVAKLNDVTLNLGRDGSPLRFNNYTSKKRKDGSQDIEYFNAHIYGREIVDTMFLSITYDTARNFPSYGLKPIINYLGLEKPGRTFVDASMIKKYFYEREAYPGMWEKSKQYAEEDSDDALKLFDLMVPAYFYFTQSVSKTFQQMINSATGAQINNMMVRSYLQIGHGLPQVSEAVPFEGGISIGIPGIYSNCLKWDLASAYPHTIIQYQLYDKIKDPKGTFLEMVNYFTKERIKNKKLAKETENQYYKDMEQSQKIVINSFFGFCGAPGLLFNAPKIAAEITRKCRSYITDSIQWATGKSLDHWKTLSSAEEVDA